MIRRVFVLVTVIVFATAGLSIGALVISDQFRQRDAVLLATRTTLQTTQAELANARRTNLDFEATNKSLVSELQQTNNQKNDAQSKNRALHEVNASLESSREKLTGQLSEATSANEALQIDYQGLQAVNNALEVDYQGLQTTNHQQAQSLIDSQEEIGNLERKNRQLVSDLSNVESSLALMRSRFRSVQSLEQRRDVLSSEIANLESNIATLESDIKGLKAARIPLLVDSYKVNFLCTGSMEPKITCLDSATMLSNFRPQDVTVGTVISFKPTPKCDVTSGNLSHRVVKIKVVRGVHYYWPKGDNSDKADNCWIPESNVNGYIIKLHKGTNAQNKGLRSSVNAAESAKERAWNTYALKYETYCGFPPNSGTICFLPQRQIDEINQLADAYLSAFNYYSCWVESAANVSYFGDILAHKNCTLARP